MTEEIKERIFEVLTEISENKNHQGLLVVFSDLGSIIARGAQPLGKKIKGLGDYNEVGHINNENAAEILKRIGDDGAVLIDEKGYIYSPAVYLNVNIFSINPDEIDPEFCARHIAALITSSTTNACVYTLSEETGKVREFINGKIKRKHPSVEEEKILEIIGEDIKKWGN